MNRIKLFLLSALALAAVSCTGDELSFKIADGSRVRLEPVSESIIRVSAVPKGAEFSREASLAVVPQGRADYSLVKTDSTVELSTAKLTAKLSLKDGRVLFTDENGVVLGREDSRSFEPISVEGTKGWTVRQVFESPEDEAFWGLGQHQADEWNYKSRNEELYQYNTKISVPFIVSSKGYGILWDSYSFCRWGDPREYAQLGEVFKLYDKNGAEGGLSGIYTASDGSVLNRFETALNQEYLIEPDLVKVIGAPEEFNFAGSNVLYEGYLEPSESGIYRFLLYYSGYHRVYIDGKEVVPTIWRTAWNPNSHKFEVELEKGRRHHLRMEWEPDGNVAYCALKVLSPVDPQEQGKMSWWGEMQDQIDYYFVSGGNADGVISGYRQLTGKAPIMPKWAMGYWQCRERYRSQEEILSVLSEMRQRHIPVDNIVQDWQYWEDDQWGSHEFDSERFPDPKAMIDSIHALGARYMISVWPKFYVGTEHYNELDRKGWIYQTAVRDSVEDWLGYQQSFYDAYDKGARELFWQQMNEHLFSLGVDAWWMDASEPNIHDCTNMDYRKAMCGPTALGPSTKYFNAYGLMNAQAIWEGQRSVAPDQRVFLLTRSGFLGLQRYSTASWSGDIGTRWEDMKTQISAGLNFAMSGIPYWTQDIGGFSVENRYMAAAQTYNETGKVTADWKEWQELQTRWHQMGVFNPLYRSHGQYPFREFWHIAPEGSQPYNAILACDKMRYALLPYIYTLASRVHFDDYTIMRPLAMDFCDDAVAREISDQFMFGDAIMVCPVYEYGARSREIYLPDGLWYDLNADFRPVASGRQKAAAPYEYIPLYARGGRIVVCGPEIEYSAQPQDGSLKIYVFTGADAQFSLYEDDGVSFAYERGEYSRIPLKWDESRSLLTIGERQGGYPGMFAEREIEIVVVRPDGKTETAVHYDGSQICRQILPQVKGLSLAAPFSNGLVLQQQSKAALWGKAKAGSTVTVKGSWSTSPVSCVADSEGAWRAFLPTPEASYKPCEITVSCGAEKCLVRDVLIGEVWFASGQSNMEMPMRGFCNCPVKDAQKFITAAPAEDRIRMFSTQKYLSYAPLDDVQGFWAKANPETVASMSATAYFFARKLNEVLDIPVGIMLCAYGGARVETWMPKELLEGCEGEDLSVAHMESMTDYHRPYMAWNAMLSPLRGYTVRGFVWYQGCSNVGAASTYTERLAAMVENWRADWRRFGADGAKAAVAEMQPDDALPFYQVEIAPCSCYADYEDESGFRSPAAELRDAQHAAAKAIDKCAIVVTNDLVDEYEDWNIHPSRKQEVGERLAYLALNRDYGFSQLHCSSPELLGVEAEGNNLYLALSDILWDGLDRAKGIKGLEVVDASGRVHEIAEAMYEWDSKRLVIRLEEGVNAKEVRYGWGAFKPGNLHSVYGLPVRPFRVKL